MLAFTILRKKMSELQDINVQIWEEITRYKVGMLKKVKFEIKTYNYLSIYLLCGRKKKLLDVKSSLYICEGNKLPYNTLIK